MLRTAITLLLVAVVLMLWVCFSATVSAHTIVSLTTKQAVTYPSGCCGGGDCAPLYNPDAVGVSTKTVELFLRPTDHPYLEGSWFRGSVPWDKVKPSPDGAWHVCLGVNQKGGKRTFFVRCLFGPMGV